MGHIVFWGLVRIAILIPALWFLLEYMEYKYWWTVGIMSVYVIVIHPAILQYKIFYEKNKKVILDTLCSNCKHFDETAVLCMKHDEHPTEQYVPCDGIDWQPK
ncbi:MAG: hypothetical protein SCALA702_32550 [Melioribacteraceae bacterium]|nr:MAG: hypothetical protein SCALA702_32550 [Melioribacteraceae bacterium]